MTAGSLGIKSVVLGMTLAVTGCGWLRGHIYHPVPVANAVGDSTTALGGRKMHVYRAARYVVFGPSAIAVSIGASHLDREYFQWTRYFGRPQARLALVLFSKSDSLSRKEADSLRAAGLLPVVYVQPKDPKDLEHPYDDVPREAIWPVAGPVSGELLAAYAAGRRAQELPSAGEAARDTLLDLYPAWYRGAVAALLADPAAPDRAFDLLHDRGDKLVPLTTLLTSRRFDVGDTTQKPARELAELTNAEGLAFLLYASEQEGPRFVAHIADVILGGGTAATAVRDARQLPHDLADLERIWKKWVDAQP